MLDKVINFNNLIIVFVLIGLYALICWLIDNFKSLVQIIKTLLVPLFQPQENLTLAERYGNWAGK